MFALLLLLAASAAVRTAPAPAGEEIVGAAAETADRVWTWGSKLRSWSLPALTSRVVAEGPFGEGGCIADLNANGIPEFVGVRGRGLGELVWIERGVTEQVDGDMDVHDCLAATLFGRRGVLAIQRGMQVRFYERRRPGEWRSRDIYSIYTPSYQTGLALMDVDGDGRTDILCGNYWIRSPEAFELPWRLYAINTWTENEDSAMVRIAPAGDGRIAMAQGHSSPARVAIFTRPKDPREPWPSRAVQGAAFTNVHGLLFDGGELLACENKTGQAHRARPATSPHLFRIDLHMAAATPIAAMTCRSIVPVGDGVFIAGPEGVAVIPRLSLRAQPPGPAAPRRRE